MLPISDTQFVPALARSILESAAQALRCKELDVPARLFVGFDRPAQDCCPDFVAWAGNIRPWDLDFPDSRRAGNLQCSNAYSIDVTLRIGLCYIEDDGTGQPLDAGTLEDFSSQLYAYGTALYIGWINEWRAGNVDELKQYDLVTVSPLIQYHEGGCAGHEFTITVGTFI